MVAPSGGASGGERVVLVVDDEPLVREAIGDILAAFGWRSIAAADGPTALRIAATDCTGVAVVLLDLRMPGMDGRATLARLRARCPELPVILMSGADDLRDTTARLAEADGLLAKPFAVPALVDCLEAALGGRGPS